MKIVRKVLLLTLNSDWAQELKDLLIESPKVEVEMASTRTTATKLITDNIYEVVVIEDTFREKNIEFILRAISTQKQKPKTLFFCFSEFSLYQKLLIPQEITDVKFKGYSLPVSKVMLKELIYKELFPMGQTTTNFDREFNQVLLRSATKVLESLGVTEITPQKPELLNKLGNLECAIRGKIIIKSEFFAGAMFVSFPIDSYLKLYNFAVGAQVKELTKEISDFAGEIANMIYGNAKKMLDENGVKLNMAIPVIDQSGPLTSNQPIYVIPLNSSVGKIYLKIAPGHF